MQSRKEISLNLETVLFLSLLCLGLFPYRGNPFLLRFSTRRSRPPFVSRKSGSWGPETLWPAGPLFGSVGSGYVGPPPSAPDVPRWAEDPELGAAGLFWARNTTHRGENWLCGGGEGTVSLLGAATNGTGPGTRVSRGDGSGAKAGRRRRGLLVLLLPAVLSQMGLLTFMLPFWGEKLTQYVSPVAASLAVSLSLSLGPRSPLLRGARGMLWGSVGVSLLVLLWDSFSLSARGVNQWAAAKPTFDSHALITGASSGLGSELARVLFAEGYHLILLGRDQARLEALKADLLAQAGSGKSSFKNKDIISKKDKDKEKSKEKKTNHEIPNGQKEKNNDKKMLKDIHLIRGDFCEATCINQIYEELTNRRLHDKIDVLVHNAGVGYYSPFLEAPFDSTAEVLNVNVRAVLTLSRLLVPHMVARVRAGLSGGSRVLFVSSLSAFAPNPAVASYSASKAFISNFARSLRRELLPEGVSVSLAHPGALRGSALFRTESGFSQLPVVLALPGGSMSVQSCAKKLVHGMRLGRPAITPGIFNKCFAFVAPLLSDPVLAALTHFCWSPVPTWVPFLGKQHISYSRTTDLSKFKSAKLHNEGNSTKGTTTAPYHSQTGINPVPVDANVSIPLLKGNDSGVRLPTEPRRREKEEHSVRRTDTLKHIVLSCNPFRLFVYMLPGGLRRAGREGIVTIEEGNSTEDSTVPSGVDQQQSEPAGEEGEGTGKGPPAGAEGESTIEGELVIPGGNNNRTEGTILSVPTRFIPVSSSPVFVLV